MRRRGLGHRTRRPASGSGEWLKKPRYIEQTCKSAFGVVTRIAADLDVDGIDEVPVIVLAGDWSDVRSPGRPAPVVVAAADRTWQVTMSARSDPLLVR